MKRLLLVGVGPHARTFYIPRIAELRTTLGMEIVAAVELARVAEEARAALAGAGFAANVVVVPPFDNWMPAEVTASLDHVVGEVNPDGVIVATDPLTHVPYARWALARGLPVLLDKPISARLGAVVDADQAVGIETDFVELAAALGAARRRSRVCVSVCAHRRWHPAIEETIGVIGDVSAETGCPVTAVHGHHSDGQWRFPAEMVSQDHHAYHQGHGKLSHSGHHFLDCAWRFVRAGFASGKPYDGLRVFASFVLPSGHLKHLGRADYIRLFGADYEHHAPLGDDELAQRFRSYGELDVSATVTFTSDQVAACNASFDLLHNGWSRRSWMAPGDDLYKGNGRVKHEHHRIHVGPFLAVHINSYQSKDKHHHSDLGDLAIGGNNHFEVVLFANTGMLPDRPPITVMQSDYWVKRPERLLIEEVKAGTIVEFGHFLHGEIDEEDMRSPLDDHAVPVRMLSGMYRSHVAQLSGENPVIEYPIA